jgi:excisionase family DNA binding protein
MGDFQKPTGAGISGGLVFDKLVWSVEDVARELSISVRHVYRLVSNDRIPYCKVGKLTRFSPVKISEWLQKGGTR